MFAVSIVGSAAAQRPVPAVGPFRESVAIHVDSRVVRSIETAREHLAQQQWSEAIPILQQVIESRESSLISIEPGRYTNSADYCHLLISLLPDEGLAAYRQQIDPRFQERFDRARDTLDEAELSAIVRSAFNSSFADKALLLLADLKFERGEYSAAREYLELLVPPGSNHQETSEVETPEEPAKSPEGSFLTIRDTDLPRELILSRLILCSIFGGDRKRAELELQAFASWFPKATGNLAGRGGLLVELLRTELRKSSAWGSVASPSGTTFAGRPSRNPSPVAAIRPHRIVWQQPVPPSPFRGPVVRPLLTREQPLTLHPVAVDGKVFVANSSSVFAFDLETGRPAWAEAETGDATIFTLGDERTALHRPDTGVPSFPLSVVNGRLFARLGPPIFRKSPFETHAVSAIVALDVGQREGQLALRLTSNQIEVRAKPGPKAGVQFEKSPEATSWSFEGPPVASDGKLFASLRQGSPEDRTVIACFDDGDGSLLWKSEVTANLTNLAEHFNLLGTNLLTLDNGRLFLSTGTGAIVALDAESGRILWVVTYESQEPDSLKSFSDPRRAGLTPCLSAHGIVFVAPPDAGLLFALEAATGRLVWSRSFRHQPRHLIGVQNGRLFVSGDSLLALDLLTGRSAWAECVSFADHAGQAFGRPVLAQGEIIWPLHDELLYVDQNSGAINDRVSLRNEFGITAGNLTIHDGRLIIARSDSIAVLAAE
jgi:outer membrane protein assembly factor BamB